MKKIAFLSHLDLNLYLFRTPVMKALLKSGNKVYAICPKGDKNLELQKQGFIVINYDIDRQGLNPFKEKIVIDNIYHAIKNLKLDILHTFTAKPNIYGTFAARKANVPVVLNLVEGLGSFYIKNSLKNIVIRYIIERLYKKSFRMSDGCVFVNNDDAEYMINKNIIQKEKVKIIKSVGVNKDKFNIDNFTGEELQSIKMENNLTNKIIILMVARAIWDKGIKEYYDSARILKKKYNNIEFLLVGNTDNGNHTCAPLDFLQNGYVRWLGHRDDIVEITAISDIYVLPSYREGLPATLMEAASMSKPIVTTDTVGCRDVVNEYYNGFLVAIRNSKALAQKIELLINDENLRLSMGKNGRQKVIKEFDVDIIVKKYMAYYKEFLKR